MLMNLSVLIILEKECLNYIGKRVTFQKKFLYFI